MSSNYVIGINNQLPWKLPEDLAWFKKNTLNKTIVMGRKTWESLPFRPLPDRKHIIITRDKNYQALTKKGKLATNTFIVHSIQEAIDMEVVSESLLASNAEQEMMIIGGATIYEQALPLCQRLYLTYIHEEFQGDAFFPKYKQYQWNESYAKQNQNFG